mmetsp:Transcript_1555/g.5483  ORF Transcript_1555/g.5483 Transcript_1555/m.5483 type:complete len:141 (-) Transcript_1555:117-539(-)|eukprot:CAMPEP_0114611840 /NCGR_PEP_ID=MMETSP0168-20121206/4321_1 /TAXON_ID=95228 ORGANISM="Vannella sp., Strain DIVA3 517/6/12" /NCGR_SAMPLE_ID=MMETSP0168 /ASSEMBLY_ACC=CAM_ASM_000044 /LENGTH=140 /DNA_ID=CAMNT_0001822821 /DNA_START=73 /DNA_END=495 /DNA_ORIENTATION=-
MDGVSEADLLKIAQLALEERTSSVNTALNSGRTSDALQEALRKPPYGIRDEKVKADSTELVSSVLLAIKPADIGKNLDSLSELQLDTLVKYIYRGLATYENSNAYLIWHEKAVAKAGLGSIVRAMAEKKSILDTAGVAEE